MKKLLIYLILIFLSTPIFAEFPGKMNWKTISTKHFHIHFPENLKIYGQRLAFIAEDTHIFLSKKERWTPLSKTDVILVDTYDDANGYSTPIFRNRVVLYLANPQPHDTISNYDEWLRVLFIHEYTHTLNMDQINGLPSLTRIFPGRYYFPNALQPIFILEGNAVFNESYYTGYGRLNSSLAEMIIRSEFLSGNIKTISDASNYPNIFPGGEIPYLYGAFFNKYLYEKYGKSFTDIMEANSDNLIPYLNNYNAKKVFGKKFSLLWNEWIGYLKNKYSSYESNILKSGNITNVQFHSPYSRKELLPVISENKNILFYYFNNGHKYSTLQKLNLSTKTTETLTKVYTPLSISFSSNNVFVTDIDIHENINYNYSVYKINSGKKMHYSKTLRTLFFDNKDNISISIQMNAGKYSLSLKSGNNESFFIENSAKQLSYCKISPSKNEILFTVKNPDASSELFTINIITKKIKSLYKTSSTISYPVWDSKGENIYFSGDRTGVFNIYRLNISTLEIQRITNVLSGAFTPAVSDSSKRIFFSLYSGKGYRLASTSYNNVYESFKSQSLIRDISYFINEPNREISNFPVENYSIFKQLTPLFWYPLFYSVSAGGEQQYTYFGAHINGGDVLNFVSYDLNLSYNSRLSNLSINSLITFNRYNPSLSIGYFDNTLFLNNSPNWNLPESSTQIYVNERERIISTALTYTKLKIGYNYNIILAGYFEREYEYYASQTNDAVYHNDDTGISLSFEYSNTEQHAFSISPENGIMLLADLAIHDEAIRSKNNSIVFIYGADLFSPSFFNGTVLEMMFQNGIIFEKDNTRSFTLFRQGDQISNAFSNAMNGYSTIADKGNNIILGGFFLHIPLMKSAGGISTFPFYLKKIKLIPYMQFGALNYDKFSIPVNDLYKTVGIETAFMFDLSYSIPVEAYSGISRGINNGGQTWFYAGLRGYLEYSFNSRKVEENYQ